MKKLGLCLFVILLATSLFAQAGPTFFYVVTAVDANGLESVFSNQATITFGQGQHNATLSWVASTSTVSGYNVYRSKVSGSGYVKINTALVSGVTYLDPFSLPNPPSGLAATPN